MKYYVEMIKSSQERYDRLNQKIDDERYSDSVFMFAVYTHANKLSQLGYVKAVMIKEHGRPFRVIAGSNKTTRRMLDATIHPILNRLEVV